MSDKMVARLLSIMSAVAGVLCLTLVVLYIPQGRWVTVTAYVFLTVAWVTLATLWESTARRLDRGEGRKQRRPKVVEVVITRDQIEKFGNWHQIIAELNGDSDDE